MSSRTSDSMARARPKEARTAVNRAIGEPHAETGMLREVLRDHGRPARFQIARCGHHNIAPHIPQGERDHVRRHEVGATNAEVEAARYNVHQATFCDDVDVNLRM